MAARWTPGMVSGGALFFHPFCCHGCDPVGSSIGGGSVHISGLTQPVAMSYGLLGGVLGDVSGFAPSRGFLRRYTLSPPAICWNR